MIEVMLRNVRLYGLATVGYRWRAMDENHNTVEREWFSFMLAKELPSYVKKTWTWYEDRGYTPASNVCGSHTDEACVRAPG